MALCSLSGCVYFVSCFAIFLILVACCRKLLNAKGMMSVLSQVTAAARWQWYDTTGINPAATRWQWYDTTGINGQRFMDLWKGSWITFGSAVNSTYLSVLDLVSFVPTIFQCLPISKKNRPILRYFGFWYIISHWQVGPEESLSHRHVDPGCTHLPARDRTSAPLRLSQTPTCEAWEPTPLPISLSTRLPSDTTDTAPHLSVREASLRLSPTNRLKTKLYPHQSIRIR